MKRLLLATAAAIALAVAVPVATAQYTTPPPAAAPYTTPIPDDPSTPQDESLRGTTTQPAPPPTSPETSTMPPPATAQTQTDTTAQTYDHTQHYSTQAQVDTTTDTYSATSGMSENVATPASLDQHARDAGMDGMPMSPQEVCMQREFTLTNSGTSLPRDKEHQLINAADRASVCEFQRVVIHSPNGRADEARQLLINSGVDAGLIEVQDGDMSGLHVQMNFAGIATSSEQYAQMFNVQQYASYQPSTAAPSYQPGATYAPSTTAPGTTPDTSFQTNPAPADTVPGRMDDPVQPSVPNPDPADNVEDESMSPTSGAPVVQPELYDT